MLLYIYINIHIIFICIYIPIEMSSVLYNSPFPIEEEMERVEIESCIVRRGLLICNYSIIIYMYIYLMCGFVH